MSQIPDPIRIGLAEKGWKVSGGPHGPWPERVQCDVLIIGSGGDHDPARPLRRWFDDGQLDEQLPHPGGDTGILARSLRPGRLR
jgi:hypothetical protein